jgi:hypothetical protein
LAINDLEDSFWPLPHHFAAVIRPGFPDALRLFSVKKLDRCPPAYTSGVTRHIREHGPGDAPTFDSTKQRPMKKVILILFASLVLFLSSCSFATYDRPVSGHNKTTRYGQKSQARYAKRNVRKYGVISSAL